MSDKRIDIILEDCGVRELSYVRPLTSLGWYVLGCVVEIAPEVRQRGLDITMNDRECEALEVAAFAHKATLHRA